MSARQQRRRDPITGKEKMFWITDFTVQVPFGKPTRYREVPKIQTRRGAEQHERQRIAEVLSGRSQAKEVPEPEKKTAVPTVAEFQVDFMTDYAEVNNKPSEIETKRMIFSLHLVPALGHLCLDAVGDKEIEKYKGLKLKSGLSPKTINNHLIVLRCLLGKAEDWKLIAKAPKIKWLKVPESDFDFLDFGESENLLAAGEAEWLAMIAIGMKAGLRQGEMLALRWRDVDFTAAKINVRQNVVRGKKGTPKGHESRSIPMSPVLASILKSHRHLKGELVFCDQDGGMLTKNMCRRPLYDICKRAGLRQIGWHVLRHTFASHLVMRGVPIKVVQELMGHKDIKTTMRYAHLSPNMGQDAVALLDVAASREATVRQQNKNKT
jgi:integrase